MTSETGNLKDNLPTHLSSSVHAKLDAMYACQPRVDRIFAPAGGGASEATCDTVFALSCTRGTFSTPSYACACILASCCCHCLWESNAACGRLSLFWARTQEVRVPCYVLICHVLCLCLCLCLMPRLQKNSGLTVSLT